MTRSYWTGQADAAELAHWEAVATEAADRLAVDALERDRANQDPTAELERWIEVGGIDGFNLAYVVTPGSFEEFVELVVPELRARGRLDQQPGTTLRGRLNGTGDAVVPAWHPAHAYRGAYRGRPSAADRREPVTEGAA